MLARERGNLGVSPPLLAQCANHFGMRLELGPGCPSGQLVKQLAKHFVHGERGNRTGANELRLYTDTNVVSEWVKPRPDAGVVQWLAEADEDRVFLSVISLAELRYGIERLPAGARRHRLEQWLSEELLLRFEGRVLSVSAAVADSWGQVMARSQAGGHTLNPWTA